MKETWSKTPPTKGGHYYWRDDEEDDDPQVFYVVDLDNGSQPGPLFVTVGKEQIDVNKMGGQWRRCPTPDELDRRDAAQREACAIAAVVSRFGFDHDRATRIVRRAGSGCSMGEPGEAVALVALVAAILDARVP